MTNAPSQRHKPVWIGLGGANRHAMLDCMTELTQILAQAQQGDPTAADELLKLVYTELHKLATHRMATERRDHTLQATALVHEAYLRLVDGPQPSTDWNGRGHFFAAAAESMRRILVENARRKRRMKHGGGRDRVPLGEFPAAESGQRILDLDDALKRLVIEDPIAARVVDLRRFAGLNHQQISDALQLSVYQVRQKWTYARAWLRDALRESE
jgi:RNA polymerase sigma factor (TIGR02999 family)